MKTNRRSITDKFKIIFEKLPKGVQKGLSWTIAILYLFGLPYAFSSITRTGIPGFFFALFLLFFLGQAWSIYIGLRSKYWPKTQGTVISSRVARYADSEGPGFWYDPKVFYNYSVAGQNYENVTLSFKQDSHTPNKEYAESIVAKYPPGGSVTVYYKPNSPSYSTLDTGLGDGWRWRFGKIFWAHTSCRLPHY